MKVLKYCLLGMTSLVLMMSSFAPSASAQVVVRVGQPHHHYYHHHHHHYHHHYNR